MGRQVQSFIRVAKELGLAFLALSPCRLLFGVRVACGTGTLSCIGLASGGSAGSGDGREVQPDVGEAMVHAEQLCK